MNIVELQQALAALKAQLGMPGFDNDAAYKASIEGMTAFLQSKIDTQEEFTEEDLNTTLNFFSDIREHLNRIESEHPEAAQQANAQVEEAHVEEAPVEKAPLEESFVGSEEEQQEEKLNGDSFNLTYDEEAPAENAPENQVENNNANLADDSFEVEEDVHEEVRREAPAEQVNQNEHRGAAEPGAENRVPVKAAKSILADIENTVSRIDVSSRGTLGRQIKNLGSNTLVLNNAPNYSGAASSKRNQITMSFESGMNAKGYFTADGPIHQVDRAKKFENILKGALANPRYSNNKSIQNFCKNVLNSEHGASGLCLAMIQNPENEYSKNSRVLNNGYDRLLLSQFLGKNRDNVLRNIDTANPEFKEFLLSVRDQATDEEVKGFQRVSQQYITTLNADKNSVIAGRNVAMSNVANILGAPDSVAKSVHATATWKGEHVQGVFTEKCKGTVIPANLDDMKYTDLITSKGNTGSFLKSLADLQVIDYICGNTDRHQSNFTYIVDPETHKLTGVQGFDNDFAFGTVVPEDRSTIGNGVPLDDITVISESMAERLKKLDDETLRAALQGNGLGEKEIDACIERKNRIQNRVINTPQNAAIMSGKIVTIKDADWDKYTVSELEYKKNIASICSNIFGQANTVLRKLQTLKTQEVTNEPLPRPEDKAKEFAKQNKFEQGIRRSELSPSAYKDRINAARGFARELNKATHWWSKTHKQFEELTKALEKVCKYEPGKIKDEKARLAFEKDLKELDEKVDAYLVYKKSQNRLNKTGEKRVEIAERIKKFTENELKVLPEARMNHKERVLERNAKAYHLENQRVDKIVTMLAEETLKAHGAGAEKLENAKELIRNNGLFRQILGKNPETIKKFGEMAENNEREKLYNEFSLLLFDFTGKDKATGKEGAQVSKVREELKKNEVNNAPVNQVDENAPARRI